MKAEGRKENGVVEDEQNKRGVLERGRGRAAIREKEVRG